jgi:membrane fusion protein (multidrug efflux system)
LATRRRHSRRGGGRRQPARAIRAAAVHGPTAGSRSGCEKGPAPHLAQTNHGSRQNEQRTSALHQEAQSAVVAVQAGIEAARQQLKVLDAQTADADAVVGQARSNLRTAQLNLGYSEIRSPIDGYVGNRAAQVGAYADQGHLFNIRHARGRPLGRCQFQGRPAHPNGPGPICHRDGSHVFHSHVVSLAPGTGAVFSVIPAEKATGKFTKIVQRVPVRVAVDPGDPKLAPLRPGLSTVVSVNTRDEWGTP